MKDLAAELLNLITTKAQADSLISRLEELEGQIYKKGGLEKKAKKLFTAREAEVVLEAAAEGRLAPLKDCLLELPVLRLTLAVEPTVEMVEKIADWAKKSLDEKVVLDFAVDENIIGGAVVEFKGKYGDFSISKRLSGKR